MGKQAVSPDTIRVLDIELTNRCNASCIICPRTELTRPVGDMSRETFARVIEAVHGSSIARIYFSGFGEPLLHPEIAENIRRLKGVFRGSIQVNTNGAALTREIAAALVESGVDVVNVSYNGPGRGDYERVMKGMRFDTLESNLSTFREVRGAKARPRLSLQSSMPDNNTRKREIVKVASSLGVEILQLYPFNNRAGHIEETGGENRIPLEKRFCREMLFVTWEGVLYPCSHALGGADPLGSVHDVDLKAIVKQDYPMCADCTICDAKGLKRQKIWSNVLRHKVRSLFHR